MTMQTLRRFGALAILVVGAVHLQQYLGSGYSAIPTIGPLFLLNAIGAGIVGVGLLAPLERAVRPRLARRLAALLAGIGVLIAAGSLAALFISESGKLFGFSEDGYSTAIVIAIISEFASIALLLPVAVGNLAHGRSGSRSPSSGGALTPG